MPKFLVYYSNPMVVEIEAEDEKAAEELFMEGEFSGEYEDPDGTLDEPNLIMKA